MCEIHARECILFLTVFILHDFKWKKIAHQLQNKTIGRALVKSLLNFPQLQSVSMALSMDNCDFAMNSSAPLMKVMMELSRTIQN